VPTRGVITAREAVRWEDNHTEIVERMYNVAVSECFARRSRRSEYFSSSVHRSVKTSALTEDQ